MPLLVYITSPNGEEAWKLARQMVENHLAAGANVSGPIHSCYRWQGQIAEAWEWQIFAQVREKDFQELINFVRQRHSHKTPCIVALPIVAGHEPFLQWIVNKGEAPCVPPLSACKA